MVTQWLQPRVSQIVRAVQDEKRAEVEVHVVKIQCTVQTILTTR